MYTDSVKGVHLQEYMAVYFGEIPEYYMVYFESGQDNCFPFKSEDLKATQSGLISKLDAIAFLGADCVYTVEIEAKNGAGQANSTGRKITIGRVWNHCV